MRFPNAYKGVSKILTSEILKIIGSVLAIVGSAGTVVGIVTEAAAESANAASAVGTAAVISVIGIIFAACGGVLEIIAYILNLVGLKQAGRDEDSFQQGFIAAIFALILTVVSAIFASFVTGNAGTIISNISEIVSYVCEIFIMLCIINGCASLAEQLGRNDIVERGSTLFKILCCMWGLTIIARLISIFFGNGNASSTIQGILGIVAAVLSIISYIIFIIYLAKTKKMLKEN